MSLFIPFVYWGHCPSVSSSSGTFTVNTATPEVTRSPVGSRKSYLFSCASSWGQPLHNPNKTGSHPRRPEERAPLFPAALELWLLLGVTGSYPAGPILGENLQAFHCPSCTPANVKPPRLPGFPLQNSSKFSIISSQDETSNPADISPNTYHAQPANLKKVSTISHTTGAIVLGATSTTAPRLAWQDKGMDYSMSQSIRNMATAIIIPNVFDSQLLEH